MIRSKYDGRYGYYRRPRVHNEKVANCRDLEFVRGRRKPNNLPDSWDDILPHYERGWKYNSKHKCQFGGSRLKIEYDDSYLNPELETYKLYGG